MEKSDKIKRYSIDEFNFQIVCNQLTRILQNDKNIVFAFLFGSFLDKSNFGDIDVAIYLDHICENDLISTEIKLQELLKKNTCYPVDVRILNHAPPPFCYSVIKKRIILIDNNEDKRVDFEMMTYKLYFDFLPFRQQYFREALFNEV